MKYNALTLIFLIFISYNLSSDNNLQGDKYELKLNLEKGKEYSQNFNSKMMIIQELNGQKFGFKIEMISGISFKVIDIIDDNYKIEAKYKNIAMIMETPVGKMEINTINKDTTDIFSIMMHRLINAKINLSMNKQGKVVVDDLDKTYEDFFNGLPGFSKMDVKQVKEQFLQFLGPDALRGNIESYIAIYPDKPVRLNESWTVKTNLEAAMSGLKTAVYELSQIDADSIIIKGYSTIETADKDAYVKSNGRTMKFNLYGSGTAEIKIDKESGWIIEAQIEEKMQGENHIKGNEQMPGDMTIPMRMEQEVVITN